MCMHVTDFHLGGPTMIMMMIIIYVWQFNNDVNVCVPLLIAYSLFEVVVLRSNWHLIIISACL